MRTGPGRVGWVVLTLAAGGCAPTPQGGGGGGPPQGDYPAAAVVAQVEERTIRDEVVVVGTIAPRDAVTVVSELDAAVQEIGFTEGHPVARDDVLFRLDPVRTQAQLADAEATFQMAKLTYDRSQTLLDDGTISDQEFDQAEATFRGAEAALALATDQHAKTSITAPFDAVAAEREVSVGQYVTRGQVLTSLSGVDPLEVEFDVPERHLGRLRLGMEAEFATPAYPDDLFSGAVTYVAPVIDARTRTVRLKATVENADLRLRPGMFGEVSLVVAERTGALLIPEAAIQFLNGEPTVVAVNGEGRTEFRTVTTGRRQRGWLEVREGLAAGDRVVVEGYQKMGPGMAVVATEASAAYGVTPGPLAPATETPAPDGDR